MPGKRGKPGVVAGLLEKIRKIFGGNIITVIFGVILLYMVIGATLYMTSSHVDTYTVIQGPLSRNETYTGLALREEVVVTADTAGYITYYAREGNKINANGAVYGVSPTQIVEAETRLGQDSLMKIRESMIGFSRRFDSSNFLSTYTFKYQLEGSILQYAGVTGQSKTPKALTTDELEGGYFTEDQINGTQSVVTYGNQTICKAQNDGIILYSMDNFTGRTVDNVTPEDFNENSLEETDLKTTERISVGDPVYTILTDERWSLLIPLSDKQAVKLSDRTVVRVSFLWDEMTQSGDFSIIEIGGKKFGKIDFNKGLIRYASNRFLDIELVTNNVTGLKIPLSSIVTKDFYTIPAAFAIYNESNGSTFFKIAKRNKDGKTEYTEVTPTIFATIGEDDSRLCYVDKKAFSEGDALVTEDAKSKYIVGDSDRLEGVYCINQGYAVFRRIEVLDQNEEYAIVKKGTTYGLVRYDHIVKNADAVSEEDILY